MLPQRVLNSAALEFRRDILPVGSVDSQNRLPWPKKSVPCDSASPDPFQSPLPFSRSLVRMKAADDSPINSRKSSTWPGGWPADGRQCADGVARGPTDWEQLKLLVGDGKVLVAADTAEQLEGPPKRAWPTVVLNMADSPVYEKLTQALLRAWPMKCSPRALGRGDV